MTYIYIVIAAYFIAVCAALVSAYLVSRDARKRGLSSSAAMFWAAVSFLLFPVGMGIYYLMVVRRSRIG
jgi:hypothetical protein